MPVIHRTVETNADPSTVYAYLRDFTNAEQWDSGTESCELVSGDGGPGTVYRNRSRFGGRSVELDYTVEYADAPVFIIVGRNENTIGRDTILVTPAADGGSTISYTAQFTFTGTARYLWPVVSPLLWRLGNDTAAQLKRVLDSGVAT